MKEGKNRVKRKEEGNGEVLGEERIRRKYASGVEGIRDLKIWEGGAGKEYEEEGKEDEDNI